MTIVFQYVNQVILKFLGQRRVLLLVKNKYENLIFVQNRFRRRRLGNFEKFHCVGGAAAAFISYRRRRLGNFQNFHHLGGDGSVFFEKNRWRRRLSRSAYTSSCGRLPKYTNVSFNLT